MDEQRWRELQQALQQREDLQQQLRDVADRITRDAKARVPRSTWQRFLPPPAPRTPDGAYTITTLED